MKCLSYMHKALGPVARTCMYIYIHTYYIYTYYIHVGEDTDLDSTMKVALTKVINYEIAYTTHLFPGYPWASGRQIGAICCAWDFVFAVCLLAIYIVQRDLEMGSINYNANGCRRGASKEKFR